MPNGRKAGKRVGPYRVWWDTGIAKSRVKAGLTQEEFATLAGVSVRTVRQHERRSTFKRETGRKVHMDLVAIVAGLAAAAAKPAR